MRGYTTQDKIKFWLFADRIPLTKLLIVANVATFLAAEVLHYEPLAFYLGFTPGSLAVVPWTILTYPLLGLCGVLCLLFQGYWMWVAGGSLERSWGTRRFALYFFTMSVISAIGIGAGALLIGRDIGLAGLWLPIAGVTVSFAMLNPDEQILFLFILPLKLKYLALLDAAIVLVSYGRVHPLLGLFALAGCAYAYSYVRPPRWMPRKPYDDGKIVRVKPRRGRQSINPLRKLEEKKQRESLEKLFERSYREEGDDKWEEDKPES